MEGNIFNSHPKCPLAHFVEFINKLCDTSSPFLLTKILKNAMVGHILDVTITYITRSVLIDPIFIIYNSYIASENLELVDATVGLNGN